MLSGRGDVHKVRHAGEGRAEQGLPVRALRDAQMHYGQSRGNEKYIKYVKKHVNFTKLGEKFEK